MRLDDAALLALRLMEENGLRVHRVTPPVWTVPSKRTIWGFGWFNHDIEFGLCYCDRKEIKLSRSLTRANKEHIVREHLLHEVAHAITPDEQYEHGPLWVETALRLGCQPLPYCNPMTVFPGMDLQEAEFSQAGEDGVVRHFCSKNTGRIVCGEELWAYEEVTAK